MVAGVRLVQTTLNGTCGVRRNGGQEEGSGGGVKNADMASTDVGRIGGEEQELD